MDIVTLALSKKFAKGYTDAAIAALPKGVVYKGAVAQKEDLPLTNNEIGDMYSVSATNVEYVWKIQQSSGQLSDWEPLTSEAALLYTPQTLTPEQQAQVMQNLGIVDGDNLSY